MFLGGGGQKVTRVPIGPKKGGTTPPFFLPPPSPAAASFFCGWGLAKGDQGPYRTQRMGHHPIFTTKKVPPTPCSAL